MTENTFTETQLNNFKKYVKVQKAGRYNMFSSMAQQATGLSKEDYLFVIENYTELYNANENSNQATSL